MGAKRATTSQATTYSEYAQQRVDQLTKSVERAKTKRQKAYDALQLLETQQDDGYVSDDLKRARRDADAAQDSVERMTARLADAVARAQAPTLAGLE